MHLGEAERYQSAPAAEVTMSMSVALQANDGDVVPWWKAANTSQPPLTANTTTRAMATAKTK